MASKILSRISESRLCPNNLFYYHSIVGLEFKTFNEKCLQRKPLNITFETIDQRTMNPRQLDHLLNELIFATGEDSVPTQREIFSNFFKKGNTCFIARKEDVLIGYYWAFLDHHIITYDDYKSKNLFLELPEKTVFFGNGFIRPAYRLKGVFPHFASYCIKQFSPENRFVTATDIENRASFNSHQRLGYFKTFQLTCISFVNFQWHFMASGNSTCGIKFHLHHKTCAMPKVSANMLLPLS
ncbi:MAG: hypothetical protein A2X86_13910 [Bdellovibrionales bacterium GWA2_49_15]|nr:MAG: hypothetical protein A2X86_13910 [Bdellovibrionales bacterium GWA2_49_15]HAZ13624.1 hypothetical protein [Bdellovibrionales bacterium]